MHDVVIIGAGIVGLATARAVRRAFPDAKILIVEKENALAGHQTGHNSGVIHSGLYYRPGSAKALGCVRGRELMIRYCEEQGLPFEICGKIVLATQADELPRLDTLYERGMANGVAGLRMMNADELRELEPEARGLRALHVPAAGIVDYNAVSDRLGYQLGCAGVEIKLGTRVTALKNDNDAIVVESTDGDFATRFLIGCAGLYSDRLARMQGLDPQVKIIPFRGEYYELAAEKRGLVRNLIYPVPDPSFPFLGVHLTRMIDGKVEAGPNAVLAFHREGYTKAKVSVRDLAESLSYPGFWKLARRYWRTGLEEMVRSASKQAFAKALARLVPALRAEDLTPGGAGVRAQALAPDGTLLDDFFFVTGDRSLHVCNAPSPAATASLAIGEDIARRAEEQLREALGA